MRDRARLLALVPADGSAIANTALMRTLGWSEHRYWYARDSLLEAGAITRAKGRGGAVRLAHPQESAESGTAAEAELVGVKAVYEALAHLRSATHAYVIFHVPREPDPQRLDEFVSVQLSQSARDRIARALH